MASSEQRINQFTRRKIEGQWKGNKGEWKENKGKLKEKKGQLMENKGELTGNKGKIKGNKRELKGNLLQFFIFSPKIQQNDQFRTNKITDTERHSQFLIWVVGN